MRRLFVSDIHLSPRRSQRTAQFVAFLRREAPRTDELYILGDLFDYWIGPKHLTLPDYTEALAALGRAARGGLRIVFIKGNRDFYMEGFSQATGIELAEAGLEHRLAVGAKRVLLCHGDYLENRGGVGFRLQEAIRSRPIEWLWTRLPVLLADAGARFYRWVSGRRTRRPRPVAAAAVGIHGLSDERVLAEFRQGTDIMVCGHVHVPGEVRYEVDGRQVVLFTLGDWTDGECYLEEVDGRWRLVGGGGLPNPEAEESSACDKAKKDSGRTGGHSATV